MNNDNIQQKQMKKDTEQERDECLNTSKYFDLNLQHRNRFS